MEKCKHKWIDMEDGSHDKFCVKCSEKAKQAMAALSLTDLTKPVLRETVTINMGGHVGSVDVYKDRLAKEISNQLHLSINTGILMG